MHVHLHVFHWLDEDVHDVHPQQSTAPHHCQSDLIYWTARWIYRPNHDHRHHTMHTCGVGNYNTEIIITSYADICKIIRIHKYYTYRTASGNVSQVCIIIGWFLQLLIKACKLFNSEFPLYSTSLRPHSCVRICQYYQGLPFSRPTPTFSTLTSYMARMHAVQYWSVGL